MSTLMRATKKDNSGRVYVGGGPRPDNTDIKRKEAKERAEAWSKLSPKEQLAALASRPGESKRQKARLTALIERGNRKPVVENAAEATTETPADGGRIKAKDRRAQEQKNRPTR